MSAISILNRARVNATDSLFRNSISLVLDLVIRSGSGYGALILLTHLYSVQAIGLSAAAVSASSLVVGFTQFGTDFSLPRYLPASKNREALINTLQTAILLSTPIVAVIFLLLPVAHKLYALGGGLFAAIFIVVATLQAIITFLGVVLSSDRTSTTLAVVNIIPHSVTLAAPPVFTVFGSLGAFLARTVQSLFSCTLLFFTLAKRGHRFRPALRLNALRGIARYSLGMYVASTVGGLPPLLLPIIILSRLSASGTAYWSIASTGATLLNLLPSVLTRALMPEISARPAERKLLLRKEALLIAAIVFPALAGAFAFAPLALAIFGHKYVSAALTPLRWLIAAGFMTATNFLPGSILFLAKKSAAIAVINVINAAIVLSLGAVWATDPRQVAIAWFIGAAANTALFGVFAYLALREVGYQLAELGGDRSSDVSSTTLSPTSDAEVPASLQQAFEVLSDIAARQRMGESARTTGQLGGAFGVLSSIAETQRKAGIQSPGPYHQMTEPQGLYSVLMLQEAERIRTSRDGKPD